MEIEVIQILRKHYSEYLNNLNLFCAFVRKKREFTEVEDLPRSVVLITGAFIPMF